MLAEYIILEGASSSREAFRPYITFAIRIETPRQERLQRGLERDGEAARPLWEEWMTQEDEYIEREHQEQRADPVINGTQSNAPPRMKVIHVGLSEESPGK